MNVIPFPSRQGLTKLMPWLMSGALMWSLHSQAGSDSVNFNVKVSVVQSTCQVNNNEPITVEFGDMQINTIDGVNYEMPIYYTLQCAGAANNQGLKLQFSGTGANFNSGLLKTSESALGLRFKSDGAVFAVNDWVPFTYGDLPDLSVVPVLSSPIGVDSGDFFASATFNVEYE
ncbi:fimbrial protein [Providencia manganoxydans]|uniref:fimbrial protein n=1 Tax=Providencia manganoxydans TaxID=2923283 RepID=UPI0032DB6D3C